MLGSVIDVRIRVIRIVRIKIMTKDIILCLDIKFFIIMFLVG